jgi:hypothetical protein
MYSLLLTLPLEVGSWVKELPCLTFTPIESFVRPVRLTQMRLTHHLLILSPAVLYVMLVTRPRATDWPAAVAGMRRKERAAAGTFSTALEPAKEAWASPNRWAAMVELAAERASYGRLRWEEERLWSVDALFVSVGCTHKKCFVGLLGVWRPLPGAKVDLYVLVAAHGIPCAVMHQYGPAAFYHAFSPRWSEPYTVLLGGFATSSPFEMVWLGSTIMGMGPEMQRAIGRLGLLLLWLVGAFAVSLLAASQRHSCSGSGGALATFAYHALQAPYARHNLFGIEMGARAALAAQFAIASLPALNGGADRPGVLLALNGLPILVGSVLYHMHSTLA